MLSVFITDPQFQGQTKDKLTSTKAIRLVETAVKDSFDHWLSSDVENAKALIEYVLDRAEARKKKKEEKVQNRKAPTKNCACPVNLPIVRRLLPKIRKYLLWKVILPAVPLSRGATELHRLFYLCAVRF